MTKEQTESFNRVRAAWAAYNDLEEQRGVYGTKDIESLIYFLVDQKDTLDCVREDLRGLKTDLICHNGGNVHIAMVESTLSILEDL